MTFHGVEVHFIDPRSFSQADASAALTDEEKARAARFRFEKDATLWTACRLTARTILGKALGIPPAAVPLRLSAHGKPFLAPPHHGLHFNLSHCPGLALFALSHSAPVGIDLEPNHRAEELPGCEETFCHPLEIAALPEEPATRANTLLRIWTAKEAVLKALGTGLSHPPEKVLIRFGETHATAVSEIPLPDLGQQRIHPLSHPSLDGHTAMLAAGGEPSIHYVHS